jgi:hypothetical protein
VQLVSGDVKRPICCKQEFIRPTYARNFDDTKLIYTF